MGNFHGLSKSTLYKRWKGIKYRCYGKNCTKYYMYGARGIKMCEEWKNDFMSFYNWSIQNGYKDGLGLTIDRIDYNGDYTPENCRWVDIYVQANNKSNVKKYEYTGQMLTIPQISKLSGIDQDTLRRRIHIGWDIEKSIKTPIEIGRNQFTDKNDEKTIEYNGKLISKNDVVSMSIVSEKLARERFRKGWSVEEIINTPFRKHKHKGEQ